MPHLYIVHFKHDISRALHVLNQLRESETRWEVDVEYGIAVHREADGTLHVQEGDALAKDMGMARGALLGAAAGILFAIAFVTSVRLPVHGAIVIGAGAFIGGAIGAAVLAMLADSWRITAAAERNVARDLGTLVRPGESVIGVLIDTSDYSVVETLFRAYDGVVLQSPMSTEKITGLERYLGNRSARVHKRAA